MESDAGVTVREAVPTDAFAVAALHLQAEREWGQDVPPRFLDTFADAWLRDRARCTLVAEDARHTPLGTIHGTVVRELPTPRRRPADAWMHLGFLYVTQAARGRGVGEALLRGMVGWCGEHGVLRLQVESADEARGLYEQVGFAQPADGLLELRLSRSPR